MSSPTTTPKRTSKRTTPKRTPLQERTPSQKNEDAGRLHKESKQDLTDNQIFTSNPFPTKPQHVLLPSTVRRRGRQNVENELPALFNSQPGASSSRSASQGRQDDRKVRRAPNLNLKRSVTALRDMYEAQAENSRPSTAQYSRPSTAAPSPALRPTTASSRLRSISTTSEGMSGRGAWEMLGLPKVSADDLSTLPTLSESMIKLNSESSFASRMRNNPVTSSPNFRTYGSSSPALPKLQDALPTLQDVATSDPVEASSSSGMDVTGMSSNFITLGHDTSILTTDTTQPLYEEDEGESSPILVKLGSTSPQRSSSPTPSHASTGSRKRKRSDMEGSAYAGRTPLFFGARRSRSHSSPPIRTIPTSSDSTVESSDQRILPSSPPEADITRSLDAESSPIIRVHSGFGTDRSSIVSAHANLQSVLSSSPGPPIQRPIVRAPNVNQFENLTLSKRTTSGETIDPPQLSPVPSVTNIEVQQLSSTDLSQFQPQRCSSRISVFTEDLDDESIAPAQAYIIEHDLNGSQVNIISDLDRHEATDELRALPREQGSFAAVLSQARSASYLGSSSSSTSNSQSRFDSMRNSMDSRLQNMRSFTHVRNDSARPGSSGSYVSPSMIVPTWARQYYSGLYRHSFQYLYQSTPNLPYTVTQVPPPPVPSRPESFTTSKYESSSHRSRSISGKRLSISRSVRSSIKSIVALPKTRLNVRQSHTTVGIGPLVSHPVRPQSEQLLQRPQNSYQNLQTIRRVSAPLSAADPRYHWNGIIEEPETAEEAQSVQDHEYTGTPRYVESTTTPTTKHSGFRYPAPFRFLRTSTPHLHQDRKLHTGSSASRGFGAPYNSRSRWQPPSGLIDEVRSDRSAWSFDLRDAQKICFMIGFVCPLTWFMAAFLPLPQRPSRFSDIEKNARHFRNFTDSTDFEEGDVVARLRLEKHLKGLEEVKWQNARWWKRMNQWMCVVGALVLIIVVVLATIGTKGHWS